MNRLHKILATTANEAKLFLLSVLLIITNCTFSSIPLLNSNPAITNKVIYLDFDGQVVSGTLWNGGSTITALASTISTANIVIVWKRVAEDYRPFDVNITTDSVRFNNAPATQRTRVVITPTSAWYGSAGGVAYIGSFAWGGTPGTPCWVFENQLGYSAKNIAEACSHEAGHTLSLRHQSTYNNLCVKTAEYNPGQGTGVIAWAPIMGVGYYNNITTWFTGTSSTSCTIIQYDHGSVSPGLTSPTFLSFLSDDVGNTYASGKTLNLVTYNLLDSGIITTPADIDVYKFSICNARAVTISVKPWALDTVAYNGANLDVRLQVYDAANNLLATDTTLTKLNTQLGLYLNPGDYYFIVDGGGSPNYSDYGSLGKYYISIKTTDPPFLNNTIVASPTTCVGQSVAFGATSNGSPLYWQWSFAGPSPTISILPNPIMTFTSAGIYTVSLLATNFYSTSCLVTKVINVGALPQLTVGANSTICPGANVMMNAGGALFYNWVPGNLAGPVLILSPSVTTIYTVTGNNGMCSAQAMLTVSVTPDFSVNVVATSSVVCPAKSATLNVSGASTYTFNPGGINGTVFVVSPTVATNYTVTGSNGYCVKSTIKSVGLSPDFNLLVSPPDTTLCDGENISIVASGAGSYTFDPGGFITNFVVLTPTSAIVFTITGANSDNCLRQTTSDVKISACDAVKNIGDSRRDLKIYPNPAATYITISSTDDLENLYLANAVGEIIFEKVNILSQSIQLPVSNLPNGIYLLTAKYLDQHYRIQKIVVQR